MTDCKKCGAWLFADGIEDTCSECSIAARKDSSITHSNAVRCPECRDTISIDHFEGGLYSEGVHEIICDHCGSEFSVAAHADWSFISPAMIGMEADDE